MITAKDEVTDLAITREDLLRLSQYHNKSCISIYIPTHTQGMEALNGHDPVNLKNQLKEIRSKLAERGMNSRQVETLVNPVAGLIGDNSDFWRNQEGGLAIFVSEDLFEKYVVPYSFHEFNYLGSEFYIKPLIPLLNHNGKFHLLTLKKEGIRLFWGNKFGLNEVDIDGIVPQRLEDSVGYDFEQKQLQHRTQWGGNKPGSFHGHGESESRNRNELLVFFREIDRGIMTKLNDRQDVPLVLCCLDNYYPLFREVTSHKNLYPEYISFNPADLYDDELHRRAWQILEPYYKQDLEKRKERFHIAFDKGKASSGIRDVIPAAVQGKIDTLFLERKAEVYGVYDLTNDTLRIDEGHDISNVSLTNLAAKKVFEQGGTVYILERGEMPYGLEYICALFRY